MTQLSVNYTSARVPRVLMTSVCDTVGRITLLAHFLGIR